MEAEDTLLQQRVDGTFVLYALPLSYNPRSYTLTTRDGTKYVYDQFEGLKSITDQTKMSSPATVRRCAQPGPDSADQLDEATEDGEFLDYDYDLTGQLEDVARSAFHAEVYRYDDAGNRLRTDEQATDNTIGDGNRIASDGAHTYGYDDEGNRTSKMGIATGAAWFYTYDHRNRMTEARQETSAGAVIQTVTFTYDALDRRIEKALDADPVRYTYMGDMIWSRTDAANGEEFFLSSGIDQWLARADASTTVWYDTDRMGTARRVVDATATILAERVYSSFGEILVDSNAEVFGEIGFAGREFDLETDLYYYRARYYDSAPGRFTSEDPMLFASGEVNLYSYVRNSPLAYFDFYGLSPEKERALTQLVAVAGAGGLGAVAGFTAAIYNGCTLKQGVAIGLLSGSAAFFKTGMTIIIYNELLVIGGGAALTGSGTFAVAFTAGAVVFIETLENQCGKKE